MERILHIVTYMGRGGLETMLMNYYRHIDRSKLQFDFLVHRDFEADYDKEILSLGGKIYHIRRLIPWSHFYKQELINFFKLHSEYRIVHVHQDCLSSVALKCAAECGIPARIAHCHSSSQDKNIKYLFKLYYMRRIPKFATHYIACSKAAGQWMFSGHPFDILPNAIEINKYIYSLSTAKQIRARLGFDSSTLVLGHVGRFYPAKNHLFLLDILMQLKKQYNNTKLLLVGDGPLRKDIEEKAVSLGIRKDIIFTGVRSDVNDLMQAMDVFVFPSLYEGLGIAVIEAQASGLPCIISDCVPSESILTNCVIQLPLSAGVAVWVSKIMELSHMARKNTFEEICAHGFDISESTQKLETYYFKIAAGEKDICL